MEKYICLIVILIFIFYFYKFIISENYIKEHNGLSNKTYGFGVSMCNNIINISHPPQVDQQCGGYNSKYECLTAMSPNPSLGEQVLLSGLVCSTCTK